MTRTNIKNLPEGLTYWTEIGYTQRYPWVEVKRTAKTVTVAKVKVAPDPEWKPNILPGGFVGHCTNQHEQTWLFDKIARKNTRVIRLHKDGRWRSSDGAQYNEGEATEFYDYNF